MDFKLRLLQLHPTLTPDPSHQIFSRYHSASWEKPGSSRDRGAILKPEGRAWPACLSFHLCWNVLVAVDCLVPLGCQLYPWLNLQPKSPCHSSGRPSSLPLVLLETSCGQRALFLLRSLLLPTSSETVLGLQVRTRRTQACPPRTLTSGLLVCVYTILGVFVSHLVLV